MMPRPQLTLSPRPHGPFPTPQRPELLDMELVSDPSRSLAAPHYVHGPGLALVRYRTTARSDGTMIRPEFLTKFFEAAGGPQVRYSNTPHRP